MLKDARRYTGQTIAKSAKGHYHFWENEMRYRKLGATGLDVSAVCLGCMSFGTPGQGHFAWTLGEEDSRPIFRKAVEGGINFFDTANVYSYGVSEEMVGKFLKEFTRRDEIVLATKVWGTMRPGPNGGGLSRKVIMEEIDRSLQRLDVDYIDLYQIHRFDDSVPIEETMEALHDIVKAGKVRYIGASTMFAWQFAKMLNVSRSNGWTRFSTMQNYVNLLYREEEREMLPLCLDEGIGVIPWSPLARGRLTRPWETTTPRMDIDPYARSLYDATAEADRAVVSKVAEIAETRGVGMALIALAWLLAKPAISAPIVGATRSGHIEDALAAVEIDLTDEEIRTLETPYIPHAVTGFR
jgi:1-deoxyxylulose-5-phosphate synthase